MADCDVGIKYGWGHVPLCCIDLRSVIFILDVFKDHVNGQADHANYRQQEHGAFHDWISEAIVPTNPVDAASAWKFLGPRYQVMFEMFPSPAKIHDDSIDDFNNLKKKLLLFTWLSFPGTPWWSSRLAQIQGIANFIHFFQVNSNFILSQKYDKSQSSNTTKANKKTWRALGKKFLIIKPIIDNCSFVGT